ncbi:MAG TPA: acetylglutamate kinase [bacterium]|nr:acetylglutamate kinase [bacterium]
MEKIIAKARVLIEALPYMKKFWGSVFVIKYGGSAMTDRKFKEVFMEDIALLKYTGVKVVIVHGGGDDISALAEKLGKKPVFVDGHRVTDEGMLEIVEMVLVGKVNKDIVKSINAHGVKAVGISGKDANLIIAKKKLHKGRDIGAVGEVVRINPEILSVLDGRNFVPVIAPLGVDAWGNGYNINADSAAAEIAAALKADKLIYVTDTDGVKIKNKYVSSLNSAGIKRNIKAGQIKGGMLPKVNSAIKAVRAGVKKVHIINGTIEHSLLLEIFTREGVGTEIIK